MSQRNWNGNALAIADVWEGTLGGTLVVGDLIKVLCSDKTFTYTAATTVIATERASLITAFNALSAKDYPELKEYTASASATAGKVLFTGTFPGRPGVLSVAITSAAGTWAISNTIPATGPNFWNVAGNWVQNTVPVTADDVDISDSSVPIMYGLPQSGVTLATFNHYATSRTQIGLPKWNPGGYAEYRDTELAIGITSGEIGLGSTGQGSSLIRLNTGSVKTVLRVNQTAAGDNNGTPAFTWRGTHVENEITIAGGSCGIGYFAGEVATVKKLYVGFRQTTNDTTLDIGDGVTMTGSGYTYEQSGGIVRCRSALQAVRKLNGELQLWAGGAVTVENWKGLMRWESPGSTIGTLTNGGEFRRLSQLAAGTITNTVVMVKDSTFEDANGSITLGNGFKCQDCLISEIRSLNFGPNKTFLIQNTATTPTIAAGDGAGTGPTLAISGSNYAGLISVTTGTSPGFDEVVATITFSSPMATAPKAILLTPANDSAAALPSAGIVVWPDSAGFTSALWTINVGADALDAATLYRWFYAVLP